MEETLALAFLQAIRNQLQPTAERDVLDANNNINDDRNNNQ